MSLNKPLAQLLLASSLGPYIGFGFRLEHAVIYGLLLCFLFYAAKVFVFNKLVFYLIAALLSAFILTIFFDILTGFKSRDGSVLASIDNLCQPILLFVIFNSLLNNKFSDQDFRKYLKFIVYLGSFAASISIITMYMNLEFILRYFVAGIDDEEGVWKQVLSLGRFTGIFAQPLEAGIYFTCCIFSLIYLILAYDFRGPFVWLLFALILVGGSISLSKNFYVLGLLLSLFLYASLANWTYSKLLSRLLIVFTIAILIIIAIANSKYGVYINSLLTIYETEGGLNAITAGRFGGESTAVEMLFMNVFKQKPFTGFGLGSHLPLDNGYLEFAYQGGLFALLGYIVFLLLGLVFSFLKQTLPSSKFLRILMVYMILSGVGGPVITCNRANILLVFLLTAILVLKSNSSARLSLESEAESI